ncbi:MAG: hypothetical protein ACFFB5_14545 [Promethearchaeota archaeon]
MTITIIFFESALELIPKSLRKHPLIRKEWQKGLRKKSRGILLDGAIHRPLLDSLEDAEKRGRPDIIHHSLLAIVYSPLFRDNKIHVIIHTRNDLCIEIPSHWRVPVNYNRFCGLFSQLLLKKRVPLSGEPILTVKHSSLFNLLDQFKGTEIFFCEQTGKNNKEIKAKNLSQISPISSKIFLIGGFQRGTTKVRIPESNISPRDWMLLTLYEEVKPAWVIAAKLIHWLEVSDG